MVKALTQEEVDAKVDAAWRQVAEAIAADRIDDAVKFANWLVCARLGDTPYAREIIAKLCKCVSTPWGNA